MGRMNPRAASWFAWSLVALAMALLAGGIVLARTTSSPELELPYGSVGDAGYVVLALATVLTFTVVGALVASRHPRNPIGWIFCTVGLVTGLDALAHGYTEFWLASGRGLRSFGETAAWFGTWAWIVQTVALTFLLLLFPDGRLPSPRWRPAAWCAGLGISGFVVGVALEAGPPTPAGSGGRPHTRRPPPRVYLSPRSLLRACRRSFLLPASILWRSSPFTSHHDAILRSPAPVPKASSPTFRELRFSEVRPRSGSLLVGSDLLLYRLSNRGISEV